MAKLPGAPVTLIFHDGYNIVFGAIEGPRVKGTDVFKTDAMTGNSLANPLGVYSRALANWAFDFAWSECFSRPMGSRTKMARD